MAAGGSESGSLDQAPLFVAITESKLVSLDSQPQLKLPGYLVEYQPAVRSGGQFDLQQMQDVRAGWSGGLILYLRNSLSFTRVPVLCNTYCLFVKVGLPYEQRHSLVGVCYRRAADPQSLEIIMRTIAAALEFGLPLILLGDFNARHRNWCTTTTTAGAHLAAFTAASDLTILNQEHCPRIPTHLSTSRDSASSIDLVIASNPYSFSSLTPRPDLPLTSDHVPLLLTSFPGVAPSSSSSSSPPPPRYRWTPEHADWQLFADMQTDAAPSLTTTLNTLIASPLPASATTRAARQQHHQVVMDQLWLQTRDFVYRIADVAVGRKRVRRQQYDRWYQRVPGVKEASHAWHQAQRNYRNQHTPANYNIMKAAQRHFRDVSTDAKQRCWDDVCERIERSRDSKTFWSNFHATMGSATQHVTSVQHPATGLPLNADQARETLAAHFAAASSPFPG